ncbi:hypothetical protein QBC47DRAFT_393588 [Echria macrotheca]|uniref:Glycosyl transferase CAP10 domain-containing protein n=1 Tax=Echria macrotheca TaxID=438768 RepID=A0AAJ0B2I6_9PEZI|nr:hypothetical protein QBC47DRAFT_393588 [Echria macrotheca]
MSLLRFPRLGALAIMPKPGRVLPTLALLVVLSISLFFLRGTREASFLVPLRPDGGRGENNAWRNGAVPGKPGGLSHRPHLAHHPIDDLIKEARTQFNQLMGKQSLNLEQAASRYRERRGRHPPPGFDKWFEVAQEKKGIIVEEFFDRIYHDIHPFWGLDPRDIRARAHNQPFTIAVRNGKIKPIHDDKEIHFRMQMWIDLVERMMPHLPDLDMYVNHMDESRVMVPWEDIEKYAAAEQRKRVVIPVDEAIQTYSGVADVENDERYDPHWHHGDAHKFWDFIRDACPPNSPGRSVSSLDTFNSTIEFPDAPVPQYTHKGYVKNFTASEDVCLQPHLRGMHGTFVEAISMSTTKQLMPIFGECKLSTNNEMLIPSAMYLAENLRKDYSGGNERGGPWANKIDGMVWRGAASGARNKDDNWWHNHRHRFIQMMNGTTVASMEAGDVEAGPTFRLLAPEKDPYQLSAQKEGQLGKWVSSWSDVAFNNLLCHPPEFAPDGKKLRTCKHNDELFKVVEGMPFAKVYDWKYVPDVDGNSFSGRYRAFLMSTSLPLKSTIYPEWHDARLMPWVHFVPFDNSYMDVYGIMDYFLNGHDEEAERIAREGQAWSSAVLRQDDMLIYTWRLLLEYARVMDDNRDKLAYVADLTR